MSGNGPIGYPGMRRRCGDLRQTILIPRRQLASRSSRIGRRAMASRRPARPAAGYPQQAGYNRTAADLWRASRRPATISHRPPGSRRATRRRHRVTSCRSATQAAPASGTPAQQAQTVPRRSDAQGYDLGHYMRRSSGSPAGPTDQQGTSRCSSISTIRPFRRPATGLWRDRRRLRRDAGRGRGRAAPRPPRHDDRRSPGRGDRPWRSDGLHLQDPRCSERRAGAGDQSRRFRAEQGQARDAGRQGRAAYRQEAPQPARRGGQCASCSRGRGAAQRARGRRQRRSQRPAQGEDHSHHAGRPAAGDDGSAPPRPTGPPLVVRSRCDAGAGNADAAGGTATRAAAVGRPRAAAARRRSRRSRRRSSRHRSRRHLQPGHRPAAPQAAEPAPPARAPVAKTPVPKKTAAVRRAGCDRRRRARAATWPCCRRRSRAWMRSKPLPTFSRSTAMCWPARRPMCRRPISATRVCGTARSSARLDRAMRPSAVCSQLKTAGHTGLLGNRLLTRNRRDGTSHRRHAGGIHRWTGRHRACPGARQLFCATRARAASSCLPAMLPIPTSCGA